MHRLVTFIIVGSLTLSGSSAEQSRPKPPRGFHWQSLEAIHASVLSPDGWKFKVEHPEGTFTYFISKEDIDRKGEFKTGFTLSCIKNVSPRSNLSPSQYVEAFTKAADEKYSLIDPKTNTQGPVKMIWFGYIDGTKSPAAIRVMDFLIASDKANTVYLIIFESPLNEWKKAYAIGEVMLKNILIDPDF